ncbi:hypothetical protein BHM03_00025513 [Ensete ventricosum]|nr:hypothetical protein BHM03_00025513 [Ensete ventricosum]
MNLCFDTVNLSLFICVVPDDGREMGSETQSEREQEMEGMYPLGVIAASVLAFLLLVGIHGRWAKGRKVTGKKSFDTVAVGFGGVDVIIIGAGVTGSALAYALGKLKQGTVASLIKEDGIVKGVVYKTKSGKESKAFAPLTIKVPSIANGEMEMYLKTIVAPQVPTELHDAFVGAIDKGNIRTMPCKSMPADAHLTPGVLLMGDAFNMRHPITGGGMTVGLSDVIVLRNLLRPLHDLHDAAALYAFYKLFGASPDEARKKLGQAYFDCLSLGGGFSSDAAALIGGIDASPLHLVLHFFVAVTLAVGHLLLPIPSVGRLRSSARLISSSSCPTETIRTWMARTGQAQYDAVSTFFPLLLSMCHVHGKVLGLCLCMYVEISDYSRV